MRSTTTGGPYTLLASPASTSYSDTGLTNGSVDTTDPQPLPASVTYTPNPGFAGTDAFSVRSFDEVSFGSPDGTVNVIVQPDNRFSFGKLKRNKRNGTAKLAVNVPGAGEVVLAKSRTLKGTTKQAASEGTVKLTLKARGKAKRKLKRKGKAEVKAKVTYTPAGGEPNTKTKRVKLKRKRR